MKLALTALFLVAITILNAQSMDKKTQPKDVVKQLFVATDQKQWDKVENCFAKEVLLDYSSMGNPAATLTPKQITDAWKTILPGFTHTHHQIGNFLESTDGKKINLFAYGTSSHYLEDKDGNIWTVVGTYNFTLIKEDKQWKVSKMKFNMKYQDGNLSLPQKAIEIVKSKNNE